MIGKIIKGILFSGLLGLFIYNTVAVKAAEAEEIKRKRIAVFHEGGFPSKSPRPVEWYKKVLSEEGLEVTVIGVKGLCDVNVLSRKKFDTLILATGGYLPIDSEYAIGMFMRNGGNIVIDGSMMTSHWKPPAEVMTEYEKLREGYLQGKNIDEYRNFICTYGVNQHYSGNLFRYDKDLNQWITPIEVFSYLSQRAPTYFQEFELEPWPNHREPGMYSYFRPFSEDLKQNPVLANTGLLKGMPEILSMEILTDSKEMVRASSGRGDGMMRFRFAGERTYYRSKIYPYANDFLIPLYVFDHVSDYPYPGFPKAGKQAKDCDSDFYIYRSHSPFKVKGGSTLIHFGVAGAHLLRSDKGKDVFISTLHLAESALPDERSLEFIETCHRFGEALTDFYGKTIKARETLVKLAMLYYYQEKQSEKERVLNLLQEQEGTFKEITNTGESLRALTLQKGSLGHKNRLDMIEKCVSLSKNLEKIEQEGQRILSEQCNPPKPVLIENRFKRIIFGFAEIIPIGITRLKDLYPKMKEIGMSIGPYYHQWVGGLHRTEELFKETGITTGYRLSSMGSGHSAQETFDMGILDPKTGTIKIGKRSWFETPQAWEFYEKDASWFLKKMNERQDISNVIYLGERDFAWTYWGKRTEKRFHKYLKEKYGEIDALNKCWGSSYHEFDKVMLPVKRPATQVEHALWEDWTRYREVYYMEEEVLPLANFVKKYAPNLFSIGYGSYYRHCDHPANGFNFYEYGKAFNPNTLEMGPGLKKEVMAADIVGFFHRNLTSEWAAFYFPPSSQLEKMDLLKEQLWNGVGWGQIGVHTFMGSIACMEYRNFIDAHNRILPVGWQLKEVTQDFLKFDHIILDGERKEPLIRILYSPTTRRHTSWPEIEGDKNLEAVVGYYGAFQAAHTQARAIDEGAILDGYLPEACRLLVIPQVTYLNGELSDRIVNFVKQGGSILLTPDSGRYDQYGHERNSLLSLAGVAPATVANSTVSLDGGRTLSNVTYREKIKSLSVLFPEETEVVLRFKDGKPAVTRTKYGKGCVIVTGIPFGQSYYGEWKGASEDALSFLNTVLDAADIEGDYSCSDRDIIVRPWQYKNTDYLVLTSRIRKGMSKKISSDGGFPFQHQPLMIPFTLWIRGNYLVKDYLLGVSVPAKFDGKFTVVSGLISYQGGAVYELHKGQE